VAVQWRRPDLRELISDFNTENINFVFKRWNKKQYNELKPNCFLSSRPHLHYLLRRWVSSACAKQHVTSRTHPICVALAKVYKASRGLQNRSCLKPKLCQCKYRIRGVKTIGKYKMFIPRKIHKILNLPNFQFSMQNMHLSTYLEASGHGQLVINLSIVVYGHKHEMDCWSHIRNTSFSLQIMNGPNKQECLYMAGLSSLE
jgi:hypothetical protein